MRILIAFGVVAFTMISPAFAQSTGALAGVWLQEDGAVTVRIAPCTNVPGDCAIVIAEKLALNEQTRLGKVTVSEIRPSGSRRWTGRFVDQGTWMSAKVQQISADVMAFKICALPFLCETKRFQRVGR